MTTASIVASRGWIIPAPFAIPPTTNPSPSTAACLGQRSVVRIAFAAPSPPSGASAADASRTPARTRSMGSGTPITPVERTTTSSGCSPRADAVSAAVSSASATPAAPVAAFATPALMTTACGSAAPRCRFDTTTGAARTRFVVQTAAPTARAVDRTTARSGPDRRIPACTPLATKPRAAVTDIRRALPRA